MSGLVKVRVRIRLRLMVGILWFVVAVGLLTGAI